MRRALSAMILAATLLLVGCAGIPTSGSVTVGATLDEQGLNEFEVRPLGPATDASQEEILRGFIAAFAGSRNDYEIARQYLSPGFSDEWDPRSGVTVRAAGSSDPITTIDGDSLRYAFSSASAVDASGALVQNDQPVSLARQFEFEQVDGQWRISQTENGLVLSDAQFHSLFQQHSLYFLDPSGTRLVPDLRWFLGGTAAVRIISTLLEGPPAWLQGAVRTAFPDGTKLANPDVAPQAGVAVVDLSTEALDADARERQLMQVQLAASLSNVASIRRVTLSVNGTTLEIQDLGTSGPQIDPAVDSRALVLREGVFGYLSGARVAPLDALTDAVVALGATGASLSTDAATVAVVGPGGVSVVQAAAAQSLTVDARTDLVVPSLDPFGFVWTASRSDSSTLQAYTAEGVPVSVSTGLPPDTSIVSVDVSRDGARIAILLSTTAGQRLVVKSITRDANQGQRPIALGASAVDTTIVGAVAGDAAWVDPVSIATIGVEDDLSVVRQFVVGGERSSLGQVAAGALSIAGGDGERGIRIQGATGTVLARSGNSWADTGVAVTFIGTQQ